MLKIKFINFSYSSSRNTPISSLLPLSIRTKPFTKMEMKHKVGHQHYYKIQKIAYHIILFQKFLRILKINKNRNIILKNIQNQLKIDQIIINL